MLATTVFDHRPLIFRSYRIRWLKLTFIACRARSLHANSNGSTGSTTFGRPAGAQVCRHLTALLPRELDDDASEEVMPSAS